MECISYTILLALTVKDVSFQYVIVYKWDLIDILMWEKLKFLV